MSSRDANSKQAASEASSIFGSHYPEMLVRYSYFRISQCEYIVILF